MHHPKALWSDERVSRRVSNKKGMALCYLPWLFMTCVVVLKQLELPPWSKIMSKSLNGMISFPVYLKSQSVIAIAA